MWVTCNFNKYFRKPGNNFKIIPKFEVQYRQTVKNLKKLAPKCYLDLK